MHYLGKRVEATATLPDGREETAAAGSTTGTSTGRTSTATSRACPPARRHAPPVRFRVRQLDGQSAQIRANPPVAVGFGPQATDEMAELMLQVLPVGDPGRLAQSLAVKRARDDILGYQSLLRADPADAVNHAALAVRYLDVGEAALAREPWSAPSRWRRTSPTRTSTWAAWP